MTSETTSDHTPILESDMPESSMGKEPQGIMINQNSLSNLLECITQMLQQISPAQMNAQELVKEDTQLTTLLPGIPNEIVQEFQDWLLAPLLFINCDRLLEMVNQFPAQLFIETIGKDPLRTALHVAVLKGSRTLIDAMVEKLKALCGGDHFKLAKHDFILKDDEFGLSAENMVYLIANKEITSCFEEISVRGWSSREHLLPVCRSPTSEDEKKNLLEKASPLLEKQAPASSDQETGQLSIREWLSNNYIDFIYCLHEAAENIFSSQNMVLKIVKFICDNGDSSFLEPLFNVRDSFGKSPLHVCYNESICGHKPHSKPLFEILVTHFPNLDWNMPDFSGRTPLHWAAAQGFVDVVTFLASQEITNLNATYGKFQVYDMDKGKSFNDDLFKDVTPLHLAVIHNHVEVVEALLNVPEGRGLNVNAICERDVKVFKGRAKDKYLLDLTPFQLATYMGHVQILHVLLKDSCLYDHGFKKNGKESVCNQDNMIPTLHLAASQFHPLAVKTLVDCRRMDILVKDEDENTALHYATMHAHGWLQVYASLSDYVTVSHFTSKPPQSRKPSDHDIITCIDILMQSGLDMEQRNKDGITPTLPPSCPEKVQTWWLKKIAKEAQEKKKSYYCSKCGLCNCSIGGNGIICGAFATTPGII